MTWPESYGIKSKFNKLLTTQLPSTLEKELSTR